MNNINHIINRIFSWYYVEHKMARQQIFSDSSELLKDILLKLRLPS